jgi:hypothetical protein
MRLVPLSHAAEVSMGSAPPGSSYNETGDGVPMIAGAGDFASDHPSPKKWTTQPTRLAQAGDLIICVRATIGDLNYIRDFDEFMRYYLVIHTGNHRIRRDEVYDEFKGYSRKHAVEKLLASLKEFVGYFCSIALGKEKGAAVAAALQDIRELRADVCYPLLMEVYQDYGHQRLTREEFIEVLRMVESYVFRRAICDIPTNSLRQTFATFSRRLKKDRYVESVKAAFQLMPSIPSLPWRGGVHSADQSEEPL